MDKGKRIIVAGGRSQIGYYLLPKLIDSGFEVFAVTRSLNDARFDKSALLNWIKTDIEHNGFDDLKNITATNYIHIAPLPLLPKLIDTIHKLGITRIIAFSSTSRYSKINSSSQVERAYAEALIESEEEIALKCDELGINWTIFRPTLVYGCAMDKNVTTIANTIKRYGLFPIVGTGKGKRQPVHADDLAEACMQSLSLPAAHNRAYNLSGAETITYGEMVDKIFDGLGKKPRRIKIPLPIFGVLLKVASFLPKYSYVTQQMAGRMNEDLCFDHHAASDDFGFRPRGFIFDNGVLK